MSQQSRAGLEIQFTILDGETESEAINIEQGAFGTIIVPTGSSLIAKTLQFVAVPQTAGKYAETPLLSTPKTLAAGANALTADEIREVGAISTCRMRVNTAVSGDSPLVLLWKA